MPIRLALSLAVLFTFSACGTPVTPSENSANASASAASAANASGPRAGLELPAASQLECAIRVGDKKLFLRRVAGGGRIEQQELQLLVNAGENGAYTLQEVSDADVERMALDQGDVQLKRMGEIPLVSKFAARLRLSQALSRLNERVIQVRVGTYRNAEGLVYEQASIFFSAGNGERPIGTDKAIAQEKLYYDPNGVGVWFRVPALNAGGGLENAGAVLACAAAKKVEAAPAEPAEAKPSASAEPSELTN